VGILRKLGIFVTVVLVLILLLLTVFSSLVPISYDRTEFTNGYDIEEVYTELTTTYQFGGLLGLEYDPLGQYYAVGQIGVIVIFDPQNLTSDNLFLNISDQVIASGEMGLLGLAIHPDFETNGLFYLDYIADNPRRTIVSEWSVLEAGTVGSLANTTSERILLEVMQPHSNHNGGAIEFGPDGYLYVALGDGGSANDPDENGQDPSTLLGSILRIDIDTGDPSISYQIPDDNPFVGQSSKRGEIWAYGLRNPWRFSFDRLTGDLWAGDVGQNKFEEVDLIVKGGNYGWNTMEGFSCFDPGRNCDQEGLTLPVTDYERSLGKSITGGYVYRGDTMPDLQGRYVYGDFVSGRIWSLDAMNPDDPNVTDMMKYNIAISSFSESPDGELYVINYAGIIYSIVAEE
jgi:glucose/arabinose dehydrogenase